MATVEMEGRSRTDRPSKQPGYNPVYASRTINHPTNSSVVPTKMLALAVEEILAEFDAELRKSDNEDALSGAVALLCERAALHLSMEPSSVARRIWEIRNERVRATRAHFADALLMAGDRTLRDYGIPELPAGYPAARERVTVYLELRGVELSEHDIDEMAKDLLEYAQTCIHGPEQVEVPQAADIVASLEGEITLIDIKTAEDVVAEWGTAA